MALPPFATHWPRWKFVLLYGGIGWGIPTAVLFAAAMAIQYDGFVIDSILSWSFVRTVGFSVVFFGLGGIAWGQVMWYLFTRKPSDSPSQEQSRQGQKPSSTGLGKGWRRLVLPGLCVISFGIAFLLGRELYRVIDILTWPSTEAVIDSHTLSGDGTEPGLWTPEIAFRYTVDGDTYKVERMGINRYFSINTGLGFFDGDRFSIRLDQDRPVFPEKWPKMEAEEYGANWPIGKSIHVYFDPHNPVRAVMERGLTPPWLLFVLIVANLSLIVFPLVVVYRRFRIGGNRWFHDVAERARTRSGLCSILIQTLMLAAVAVFAFVPADFEFTAFFPYGAEATNRGRQGTEVVEIILLKPWVNWSIYGAMSVTVLSALVYAYRFYRPRPIVTLIILGAFVGVVSARIGFDTKYYLPVLLLAGWGMALRRSERLLRYGVLALILAVSPISCGSRMGANLAPWQTFDAIETAGAVYRFMDSSFMQGQTMALAVDTHENIFFTRRNVIGITNGDSPRSYLLIVRRDADAHEGYGQLYPSPDNVIVGVRSQNKAYFAYDTTQDSFYGHGPVENLSPFILIDEHAALHDSDVRVILSVMRDTAPPPGYDNIMGVPRKDALENELCHPNAAVRTAAKKMIEEYNPRIEKYHR